MLSPSDECHKIPAGRARVCVFVTLKSFRSLLSVQHYCRLCNASSYSEQHRPLFDKKKIENRLSASLPLRYCCTRGVKTKVVHGLLNTKIIYEPHIGTSYVRSFLCSMISLSLCCRCSFSYRSVLAHHQNLQQQRVGA